MTSLSVYIIQIVMMPIALITHNDCQLHEMVRDIQNRQHRLLQLKMAFLNLIALLRPNIVKRH